MVKLFGFWATIVGGTLGGIWIMRIGMNRALWMFGLGPDDLDARLRRAAPACRRPTAALATVVALENFTAGLGTAAFVGFMAALTDKRFTATQYALLSSLMGVPRVLAAAPTGWLAAWLGWAGFFVLCALIAIPGLMLLRWITRLKERRRKR